MGIAREKMEQYKTMAEFLGSKRYTPDNVVQYFNTVFGSPAKEKVDNVFPFTSNNAKIAMEYLDTQPGANFAQGSFWKNFNTVTYMTDHIQGRSNDGRMTSSWYGRNRRVKLKALDTVLNMQIIQKSFVWGLILRFNPHINNSDNVQYKVRRPLLVQKW